MQGTADLTGKQHIGAGSRQPRGMQGLHGPGVAGVEGVIGLGRRKKKPTAAVRPQGLEMAVGMRKCPIEKDTQASPAAGWQV